MACGREGTDGTLGADRLKISRRRSDVGWGEVYLRLIGTLINIELNGGKYILGPAKTLENQWIMKIKFGFPSCIECLGTFTTSISKMR